MGVQRSTIVAAVIALITASAAACGGDEGRIREQDEDQGRRAGTSLLADKNVVDALKAPQTPGRIIYDPPTDLSYANAQRTRPDLVRPDTSRRGDTSKVTVRRDTTAGDAAMDTSGGAARPRKP